LLRLKRLQILGFKSFCDRTELRFPGDGVAAIVGPNGCGKSNISDAISWVLGEQSAKSLRGARMEDVIFAGTPARKATGMAEVSLTLIDPEVYDGPDANEEPQIEIRDDMPDDDWDEESLRATAEQETDEYIEELRPHVTSEQAVAPDGQQSSTPDAAELEPTAAAQDGVRSVSTPSDSAPADAPASAGSSSANAQPQVVLKIRRRKFNRMALKKGEIIVTRRLFRSGDSEYLLNHKLCRLRDIQDIFMGTGLGPESYAIIEQGRIGQILSSKPTDRRAIIEEAAGITKFKQRKRLAEARLEDSKLNLSRVNDIFEEVTRQMNSLKRQAAKAERYGKLRDQMRDKLRTVLASRFTVLEREQTQLQGELEAVSSELNERTEAVRTMENEHGERQQRGYAIDSEARQTRERLAQITLEHNRASSRRQQNEERCAELQQRSEAAKVELSETESRLHGLTAERDANRQSAESAAADVASAQAELRSRQQAANTAANSLTELERAQEHRRNDIFAAASEAANIRNRITQSEERMAGLERESNRLTGEINSAKLQLESFGGERGQLALEYESASQRAAALTTQIAEARRQIEEKRRGEAESKRQVDKLRAEYATALGRKSSLEASITQHRYSTESVRRLFDSGKLNNGFAPAGVLADFLEVDDRYEGVIEDFLRDELNYVVVKSWDAADAGLQVLRTDVDGRATFMVHPNDSQARFSFLPGETVAPQSQQHSTVTPLKNCIRVLDGFGKSLEVILPKLRDGYIVPDAGVGRSLALENPDAFFLSQSGETFHNVTVTGGRQGKQGPLSLKRELRDASSKVEEIERALREQEARVLTIGREISDLNSLIERLDNDKREAEKQAMTSGHTLRQLETEMTRVRQRLETYERELQRVARERGEKELEIDAHRQKLEAAEARRSELEQAMAAAQEQLVSLRTAREASAHEASEAMAHVATLEERRRAAAQNLARIEAMVADLANRVNALKSQMTSAANEQQQRSEENVRLAAQVESLMAEREQHLAREKELQAETEEIRARLAELESQLREGRQALDAARDRRGELSAAAAKIESDTEHMAETAMADLGATRETLIADESIARVEGDELAASDGEYRDMRTRLESMGPVNMMALEEYNEVAQRHEFLVAQRKDLQESIENTHATIKEIETVSRLKFEEAFHKINENFSVTFTKLFGGGQAFMRLTDEENSAESGIDVVASPPGKKLQNVLLLSGGEKALTALSLLVGIFQYQPSPFCILDEVDAPLDEANIGRFTQLVRDMSVQTQFVIITHSKKTMSIAPVMYGVTMQEPGVSRLVSVRFEGQMVN
jgi:chromosome segregation protein